MARAVENPPSTIRVAYQSLQHESELVVAVFRTVLIMLALLAARVGATTATDEARHFMGLSILTAFLYNAIVIFLGVRRIYLRGQRWVMVLADLLIITAWIYFTWNVGISEVGSPLFPFYYLVIIVSALWFGITGTLLTAALAASLYLLTVMLLSTGDPLVMVDAIVRQLVYLFLAALLAGYVAATHKREREQWARSQVLLAQYQERFRAAQEMYEMLIPAQVPQVPGLELAARWRPALQEGGGDFYDIIPLDDGRVVITIADVSGKDTRGVTKLPIFKAAFLATIQLWDDPGQILSQVNRIVYPLLQPDMFITACVIIVDLPRQRLSYANAGQDAPVFVRAQSRQMVTLETGGLVLGVDAHAVYPTETQRLEPGDTLCLYTDGIVEARDVQGTEFGIATLEARMQAGVGMGLDAETIADNLFETVNQYINGERRHDDMTLVVMRYQPATNLGPGSKENTFQSPAPSS